MQFRTESIDTLRAWLAAARCGERFIYACAARVPQSAPVVNEVRLLHDAGQLLLTQRKLAPGCYEFLAIKRRDTRPPQSGFHDAPRPMLSVKDAAERVLAEITAAQARGADAPNRIQLARTTMLAPETVDRVIRLLAAAGEIEIKRLRPIKRTLKVRGRRMKKAVAK